MRTKARAWIEDGAIRCCSQMCEVGGVPCPRVEKCEIFDVQISKRKRGVFSQIARAIKWIFGRRGVDRHATSQEKRQT